MKLFAHLAVFAILLSGCATTKPEVVPALDPSDLPPLELASMKPRVLEVSIENTRKVNREAKNTAEVEKAVLAALSDAVHRGNLKQGKSRNRLHVRIVECEGVQEGAECVMLVGKLQTATLVVSISASGTHGLTRPGSSQMAFGEVSGAYQVALKTLIEGIDGKYRDLSKGK